VAPAEELHKQLLTREEEMVWREDALAVREEKARIFDMALVKVSADLDAEQAKLRLFINSTSTRCKHTLDLDKMLGEKKVQLHGKEGDLDLREVVLAVVQFRGLNPRDNLKEMMELQRCL
jgi:hypothetical protein